MTVDNDKQMNMVCNYLKHKGDAVIPTKVDHLKVRDGVGEPGRDGGSTRDGDIGGAGWLPVR